MAVVAIAVLAAMAGCDRSDRAALDAVQDLGPFEQFAEYKTVLQDLEPGRRHIYTETPKLVIVVRPGLSKADLERVANAYVRANPGAEIDFFDSKERLDNYVNLDSFDPRSNYKPEMTLDDDFKVKHLKARVRKSGSGYFVDTDAYVPYGLEKRSPAPQ